MEFIYNPRRNTVIHKVKTQMSVIKYCAKDYNEKKKNILCKRINRNRTFVCVVRHGFSEVTVLLKRKACPC